MKIYPGAVARLSDDTAALLSLKEGDIAKISTKVGNLELPVSIDEAVGPSVVMLTNNFEGRGVYSLMEYTIEPVLKTPCLEGIEIQVDKVRK